MLFSILCRIPFRFIGSLAFVIILFQLYKMAHSFRNWSIKKKIGISRSLVVENGGDESVDNSRASSSKYNVGLNPEVTSQLTMALIFTSFSVVTALPLYLYYFSDNQFDNWMSEFQFFFSDILLHIASSLVLPSVSYVRNPGLRKFVLQFLKESMIDIVPTFC